MFRFAPHFKELHKENYVTTLPWKCTPLRNLYPASHTKPLPTLVHHHHFYKKEVIVPGSHKPFYTRIAEIK